MMLNDEDKEERGPGLDPDPTAGEKADNNGLSVTQEWKGGAGQNPVQKSCLNPRPSSVGVAWVVNQ
jgi:hypothetical protein